MSNTGIRNVNRNRIFDMSLCGDDFIIEQVKYVWFRCNLSTPKWGRSLESFLVEYIDPFILNSQYHGCWAFGDASVSDIIMDAVASQITSVAIVFSTVYSAAEQRKHQSSASLAIVRGIQDKGYHSLNPLANVMVILPQNSLTFKETGSFLVKTHIYVSFASPQPQLFSRGSCHLTHWGWDKMAAIS